MGNSYGTAILGSPAGGLRTIGCGTAGSRQGKIASLLSVGRTLYAITNLQDEPWPRNAFAVWSSTNGGRTWSRPEWTFDGRDLRPMEFVQFGPGNTGAPDGYAYMTAIRPNSVNPKAVYLMRVPGDGLGRENAYQYWDGKGTGPSSWTGNPTAARPIFDDPHGAQGPVVTYDRGLHLYLMTVGHGTGSGGLGVFAAPTPMGPWKTVEYDNRWLNIGNGEYLGLRFPGKWISPDGRVLEGVFSCYGRPGCGRYHDQLNLMQAVLVPSARRGAAVLADSFAQARARPGLDTAALGFDLDELAGEDRLGLSVFPVGPAPAAPEPSADPGRARFEEAYGLDVREGGIGLAYGLPGGTRLTVVVTTRGDAAGGGTGLTAQTGFAADLRQHLGVLALDTSLAYSRDGYGTAGLGGQDPFDGRTVTAAQRVALPLDVGGGVSLTPWAGLAYVSQTADGLTLRDPFLGEQRYSGLEVGEVEASLGLDGALEPVRLGERTWLTLHGGVSYTQGLGGGDYRVRVAALGTEREETVTQPPAQVWGLRLGGRLTVGGALALDAGLALEDDLATGAVGTGRVSFTWTF